MRTTSPIAAAAGSGEEAVGGRVGVVCLFEFTCLFEPGSSKNAGVSMSGLRCDCTLGAVSEDLFVTLYSIQSLDVDLAMALGLA